MTGMESTPDFVDLLRDKLKSLRGSPPAGRDPRGKLEARSYLSRHSRKYSIIQMALIDTWAFQRGRGRSRSRKTPLHHRSLGLFLDRLRR